MISNRSTGFVTIVWIVCCLMSEGMLNEETTDAVNSRKKLRAKKTTLT